MAIDGVTRAVLQRQHRSRVEVALRQLDCAVEDGHKMFGLLPLWLGVGGRGTPGRAYSHWPRAAGDRFVRHVARDKGRNLARRPPGARGLSYPARLARFG